VWHDYAYPGDAAAVPFCAPGPVVQRQSPEASSATDDEIVIQVNVDPIESCSPSSCTDKNKLEPINADITSIEFGRSHQYVVCTPGGATEQNRPRVTENGVQGRYVKSW